jgi:diguanylate cyclase (GGDEF)-like protein
LWERFAGPYRSATGLTVTAFDHHGNPLIPKGLRPALCPVTKSRGQQGCTTFYRKAVQQSVESADPVLFRCPHGFLIFAAPVRFGGRAGAALVVAGGPALPEAPSAATSAALARSAGVDQEVAGQLLASAPVLDPKKLQEFARLAQVSLQAVLQGNCVKETFSHRQTRVMTLFDVASDLSRASSVHELYAVALSTLGVLFDVACAAILACDARQDSFHVQTAMGPLERGLRSWSVPARAQSFRSMAQAGDSVRIQDLNTLGKLGLSEQVEGLFATALRGSRGLLGLLVIVNAEVSSEDEQMIRGFAIQLSVAIENQRLQRAVAGKTRELETIKEMNRQFLPCVEAENLFRVILEQARKLTGAQKCSLMVAVNGSGELAVRAVNGMDDRVVERLRVQTGEGIAGRVFATGQPILVRNVERDRRFRRANRPRYSTKSFLSLPIVMGDHTVGVVNLSDKTTGEIFSDDDLNKLRPMATQASIAIGRTTYYEQSRELRKISITDSLTGLLNRRYFQERLAEEVDRSIRHDHPLALMMIDIDHFKMYNDANGHLAGDKALTMVGRALRGGIRGIDVVSRFGGEEFAVILPDTRTEEALEIGERIRKEVEDLYFPGEESLPSKRLTISLGVAGFPQDAQDLKDFIQMADRALYRAKAHGRNYITAYGGQAPPSSSSSPSWTKVL